MSIYARCASREMTVLIPPFKYTGIFRTRNLHRTPLPSQPNTEIRPYSSLVYRPQMRPQPLHSPTSSLSPRLSQHCRNVVETRRRPKQQEYTRLQQSLLGPSPASKRNTRFTNSLRSKMEHRQKVTARDSRLRLHQLRIPAGRV